MSTKQKILDCRWKAFGNVVPTLCQALCYVGRGQRPVRLGSLGGRNPMVRGVFYVVKWRCNRIWRNVIWPSLSLNLLGRGLQKAFCSWNSNSKAICGTSWGCFGKCFPGFSVSWGLLLSHLMHSVQWSIIPFSWWGDKGLRVTEAGLGPRSQESVSNLPSQWLR